MIEQDFYLTFDSANAPRSRGKYHGFRWAYGKRVTACSGLGLSAESATSPAEVPEARRCRAGGCRQQWDAWLREAVS